MEHGLALIDYPVTVGPDELLHRITCKCRIAVTGATYGLALAHWGDHAKRCQEGLTEAEEGSQ